MKVTTSVHLVKNPQSKTKAMATIVLGDAFCVKGIRIVDGNKGLFVSYPQRKTADDEYEDVAYPINSEVYQEIKNKLIADYKKLKGNSGEVEEPKGDNDGFMEVPKDEDQTLPFN